MDEGVTFSNFEGPREARGLLYRALRRRKEYVTTMRSDYESMSR